MNFQDFLEVELNEDVKSAMQAAHSDHERQVAEITRSANGADRTAKLKAAAEAHARRKDQIRKNLGA